MEDTLKAAYTVRTIIKVLGIERGRAKDWIKNGYIYPSIQRSEGGRQWNLFDIEDLYLAATFKFFVDCGIKRSAAVRLCSQLGIMSEKDREDWGWFISLYFGDEETPPWGHFELNFNAIRSEVDGALDVYVHADGDRGE